MVGTHRYLEIFFWLVHGTHRYPQFFIWPVPNLWNFLGTRYPAVLKILKFYRSCRPLIVMIKLQWFKVYFRNENDHRFRFWILLDATTIQSLSHFPDNYLEHNIQPPIRCIFMSSKICKQIGFWRQIREYTVLCITGSNKTYLIDCGTCIFLLIVSEYSLNELQKISLK